MLTRAIKIDSEGYEEWQFGSGYGNYKSDLEALKQDIYTALKEWQNDCFWALDSGIDWQTRLGYKNQKELLDYEVYNVIQNRDGVLFLQNFNSSLSGRAYTCTVEVLTAYSDEAVIINYIGNDNGNN